MAEHLPEVRRLIREKGYRPAYDFMLAKAKEQGYPGLSWTDPFHPGFELTIDTGAAAGLDGSKDVYVDLRHAERATCGWGEARNGASVTGKPLAIGSVTFVRGIGTHAPAEIVYRPAGKYRWLTFHAGISAEMVENGSVVVQVWLDGKKAHETAVLRIKEEPVYVCLPIDGVQEIRLVATDAGNGIGADHACFGNLRLCVGKDKPEPDEKPKPVAEAADESYLRTENFETGEVTVRWRGEKGTVLRRLFVSRPHNTIVLSITSPPKGTVSCSLGMAPIGHTLIQPEIATEEGWITCHNVYVKGKGGYDGAARVVTKGGTVSSDGRRITARGADEVLVLMRIEPWTKAEQRSIERLKAELARLPADYAALLAPHAKAHGEIFRRVRLDLGADPADRRRTTEDLFAQTRRDDTIPPALLEKIYDACRYVTICSAGELPPNLQGIWTGTWKPSWSGDFTTDTNVQLAIAAAHSANMPELMEGFFRLLESMMPEFRENARKTYGCRGVFLPTRISNCGLNLHWGNGWPGQFWTCGAGWVARWFYDHYLYTGDRAFLAERAVPFMREVALFYEDFLFIDDSGRYRFSPSFSAENGMCHDNATQDIAVAKEVLTNLIAACEELGIEAESIPKWKAMLAKMPPYLINAEGCLQEWATPGAKERHNHRHFSNLYPVIYSYELTPEETPELWQAAHVALDGRLKHWFRNPRADTSSHGRMHAALAAAYLRRGEDAWEILTRMVTGGSFYTSLVTAHYAKGRTFNVDANGATPEILNTCLVFSWRGTLDLLPALPEAMPKGTITGLLARGQFRIDRLTWDKPAGTLRLELTSAKDQTVTARLPNAKAIKTIRVSGEGARVEGSPRGNNCRALTLRAGKPTALDIRF